MVKRIGKIGKKLVSISHNPFIYSNSVYGIVGMKIEDATYKVTNLIEVRDYFGEMEDVAVFKVTEEVPKNEIFSKSGNRKHGLNF